MVEFINRIIFMEKNLIMKLKKTFYLRTRFYFCPRLIISSRSLAMLLARSMTESVVGTAATVVVIGAAGKIGVSIFSQ